MSMFPEIFGFRSMRQKGEESEGRICLLREDIKTKIKMAKSRESFTNFGPGTGDLCAPHLPPSLDDLAQ